MVRPLVAAPDVVVSIDRFAVCCESFIHLLFNHVHILQIILLQKHTRLNTPAIKRNKHTDVKQWTERVTGLMPSPSAIFLAVCWHSLFRWGKRSPLGWTGTYRRTEIFNMLHLLIYRTIYKWGVQQLMSLFKYLNLMDFHRKLFEFFL